MAKHWIQKAIKHPGALHRAMGVEEGEKIPRSRIVKAAKGSGNIARMAKLALTLGKMHHK